MTKVWNPLVLLLYKFHQISLFSFQNPPIRVQLCLSLPLVKSSTQPRDINTARLRTDCRVCENWFGFSSPSSMFETGGWVISTFTLPPPPSSPLLPPPPPSLSPSSSLSPSLPHPHSLLPLLLYRHNSEPLIAIGLNLVTVAIETGATSLCQFPSLASLAQDGLCRNLMNVSCHGYHKLNIMRRRSQYVQYMYEQSLNISIKMAGLEVTSSYLPFRTRFSQ